MGTEVKKLSEELKRIIARYEHRSFLTQCSYWTNGYFRMQRNQGELHSPLRQMMYLVSLYHRTGSTGTLPFMAYGEEFTQITDLLNRIEACYIADPDMLFRNGFSDEQRNKVYISNTTFLNYYVNGLLTYSEQDIERIRRTFYHFNPFIKERTGLEIEDFIQFFITVNDLETEQYQEYFADTFTDQQRTIMNKVLHGHELSEDESECLLELSERKVLGLAIPVRQLEEYIESGKVHILLQIFTLVRKQDPGYLYYTDPCPYLASPILMTDPEHFVLVYSKQLIHATYEYLFELCSIIDEGGRRVLRQRESYLESKTAEIFRDFFGKKARLYTNYYVGGAEKDLLVITDHYAFVIECKANKYRIPFRDPVLAYDRIKDDFKRGIGKAYNQAKEVTELFMGSTPFDIKDSAGKVQETIYPGKIREVFSIIVTQERFGQIQCNLGHLLEIGEIDDYPWAICIDDLETFLITLERKMNHQQELVAYLLSREKLHGRLYCFDELELCAYFILDKQLFMDYCDKDTIFLSSPDMHYFFDELYHSGFGFADELKLSEKRKRNSLIVKEFTRKHKLQPPLRFRQK